MRNAEEGRQVTRLLGEYDRVVARLAQLGVNILQLRAQDAPCSAVLHHGPGHQSTTWCRLRGPHEEHEAIYGSDQQVAWWRDGQYQRQLKAAGHPRDEWPEWVNEGTAMTGFFDEPPREEP